jgi:excisionase family DNA binding protein
MNTAPDTFISLQEVARRLSVTTRTLYREIAAKRFPSPLKVGHSSRVLESDYAAYVATLRSKRTA